MQLSKPSTASSNQRGLICLCLTAACLSFPLNGLSPSMSIVAKEFNFDQRERDIYLGSYIGFSTMIGQLLGSCLSGILTDIFPRRRILIVTLYIGFVSTLIFGCVRYYITFLFLRVIMGACQSAAIPVLFSLIGDFYKINERGSNSAIVSSCLGGGTMIGQLFTGFFLPSLGWRIPFIIMGICSLFAGIYLQKMLVEPKKGGNDEGLSDLVDLGIALPPMSLKSFFRNLTIPTVLILMLQTIPNTVPWGVLSVHLHDILATDSNLSMQQATSLIAIFGFGAAMGGIFGGFAGAKIYAFKKSFLPLFMGITLACSSLLLQELLSIDLSGQGAMQFAGPVLILAGAMSAINGANLRVVVINLTSPEARGASIASLNFINSIGRGFGPYIIEVWMSVRKIDRRDALSMILNLWLLSGFIISLSGITIGIDEEKLKIMLKKFADDSIGLQSTQNQQMNTTPSNSSSNNNNVIAISIPSSPLIYSNSTTNTSNNNSTSNSNNNGSNLPIVPPLTSTLFSRLKSSSTPTTPIPTIFTASALSTSNSTDA
eukprot:gene8083-10950_t